jgi:hypothetical protein
MGSVISRNSDGAGIAVAEGSVTISASTVTGNRPGGGIRATQASSVDAKNTLIAENFSSDDGGGVWMAHGTLMNVTVDANVAARHGGGIFSALEVFGPGGSFLSGATVTANTAGGHGGGVYNEGVLHSMETSIADNHAAAHGGGIYNAGDFPALNALTLATTAVTRNTASRGGGLFNAGGNVLLLAGNSFAGNAPDDCVGTSGC